MEHMVLELHQLVAALAVAVALKMTQARTQQRNADLLVGVSSPVLVG
jgi:hypothetical protein